MNMRQITLLAFIAALVAFAPMTMHARNMTSPSSTAIRTDTRVDTIPVPDMQCESCEKKITKSLKPLKGITKVVASAENKQVIVTYKPNSIQRSVIEQRIAEAGYDAGSAHATDEAKNALPMCCRAKGK
jgi:copper chaperone CopZ